jgi:hypothetical protein
MWIGTTHSRDFEIYCVAPAKEFVIAAGTQLKSLIPGLRAEPKIAGSIPFLSPALYTA